MKTKYSIPSFVVIIIIIALVGLGIRFTQPGMRGFKYLVNKITKTEGQVNTKLPNRQDLLSGIYRKQPGPYSDYQIIVRDNLFSSLGGIMEQPVSKPVIIETTTQYKPQVARSAPPGELILTGIVNLGDSPTALIEDTSTKKPYFLEAGDKFQNFFVESINDESITLLNDGNKHVYKLGSKFYYGNNEVTQVSNLVPPQRSASGRTLSKNEQPKESASIDSNKSLASPEQNSSNLSLIEQMKARRRKELGQE